jgi:hypothetical protein
MMPRPRPPHVIREKTRHGHTVWYVRIDKGPRIRLRAEGDYNLDKARAKCSIHSSAA